MLKTLFFTILLALNVPAFAGSFMNHEKFVHLSYEEQKKIVISMMELMTEMEHKYHREVKTSGFDQLRFERYTDMMRKFSNLLFPEAYAAKNVRYGQYLNELRTIVSPAVRNKCLYGGWISDMNGDKCVHPNFASSQLRSLYQSEAGCTGGRSEITCNPAVFGFKNVAQKTLFCVAAGEGRADNSSRDCMVKALSSPPEAGASSVDERIQNMIAGISANPNDANAVFDFLVKACACDAGKSPQISTHYANYMRPHQTCYAILRMMSEFGPRCPAANSPFDPNQLTFLQSIKGLLTMDQIRQNENAQDPSAPNVRTSYNNGLNNLRSENAEFRNTEAAVCGTSPATVTTDNSQCPEDRRRTSGECCEPNQIANADKTQCIARPNDTAVTVTTGGTTGTPNGGGTTTTTNPTDIPTEVEEIVVTGRRCNRETHEWVGPDETMQCLPKCPPGTTRNADNSCPSGDPTPNPTCNASENKVEIPVAERTPNGPTCKCSDGSAIPENGTCPAPATTCNATENKVEIPAAERTPNGPACKCSNGDPIPESGTCPAPASTSLSISVTSTNKSDNTNATITLTVTPSDYKTDEYDIIWFRKGWPGGTNTPPQRRGTTGTLTGDFPDPDALAMDSSPQETPEERREKSERPGENETRISGKDGLKTFDVERNPTKEYSVCARVIKKSDGSKVADGCGTVQKRPQAAGPRRSNGMMNPMMQQPMMPTRGGASDAVFRGVR